MVNLIYFCESFLVHQNQKSSKDPHARVYPSLMQRVFAKVKIPATLQTDKCCQVRRGRFVITSLSPYRRGQCFGEVEFLEAVITFVERTTDCGCPQAYLLPAFRFPSKFNTRYQFVCHHHRHDFLNIVTIVTVTFIVDFALDDCRPSSVSKNVPPLLLRFISVIYFPVFLQPINQQFP